MYALILMATLTTAQGSYHSQGLGGGINVEVEKFDTSQQCEKVKNVFLNDMNISHKDLIYGSYGIRSARSKIHREAECVKL